MRKPGAAGNRATAWHWLRSLLALVLLGCATPVWAACGSPQTATVASGGQAEFYYPGCASNGFKLPSNNGGQPPIAAPQHGTLSEGNADNYLALVYTNNSDGALSDTFTLEAWDTGETVTFNITVGPASGLTITPATLPTPNIGVAYSESLSASGGTAPYTYSNGGGDWPPGLSISTSGVISGTPTQSGSHTFTVNVSDSGGVSAIKTYTVDIPAPALDISPDTPTIGIETLAYNLILSGSGGTAPYTFTLDSASAPLPTGLSLASSGAITGTPPALSAGSYTVRIVMKDSTTKSTSADTHSIFQDFTFVIQAPPTITVAPASLPDGAVGVAYDHTVSASGGTMPYTFALTGGSLPAGMTLNTSTGQLTGTPTAGGTFYFTVTATDDNGFGGSLPYALDVLTPPSLTTSTSNVSCYGGSNGVAAVAASGGTAPYSYSWSPSGGTGATAIGLAAGTYTVTVTDSNSLSATASATITQPTALTLSASSLPNGVVGDAYSQTLTASGGTDPKTFTAGGLPAWLTLASDGTLSGTPTTAGTSSFTVQAEDQNECRVAGSYSVTVESAVPVAGNVAATVGYGSGANPVTLALSGGAPDSVAVATPPAHGTAVASGTSISYQPDAGYAGPDSFTYTASNADGTSAPATVSITVSDPVLAVTASAGWTARIGESYSQTFTFSGGAAPYGYNVTGLPAGLMANSGDADSVTVSGTPTETGSFTVTATATDSSTGTGPFTVSDSFTLQVDPPANFALSPAAPEFDIDYLQSFSQAFSASGGSAPYAYTIAGVVPDGLSFDGSTGVLSGAPTEAGLFPITITATDSSTGAGGPYSVQRTYTLDVTAYIPVTPTSLPDSNVGDAYLQTLSASGGAAPYRFSMNVGTSLPPGLSVATDGTVSGTPTTTGTYSFNIKVTDANGVIGAHGYTVTIDPATLTVTPAALPAATVDTFYSETIATSGGVAPYRYMLSAGALPAGFTLDPNTGVLSGSTSTTGTFNFDVQVTGSGGGTPATATVTYSLAIGAPNITIGPAGLPAGTRGSAYSQTLTASGGIAPYRFAVSSGALPTGLSLSTTGVLSGTPGVPGTASFAVTATDSSGGSGPYSGTVNYTLAIADVAPTAGDVSATVAYGSGPTAITLDISGSAATSVAVAGAPAHGSTSVSGLSISYRPDAGYAGTDSFTYIARNATGDSAPATVSITVRPPTLALNPAASTLSADYGTGYSQGFSASGGAAPYSYALTGTLPAGLGFDATSGTLSGTPTQTGDFAITVIATDSSTGAGAPFSVAADYTLRIEPATIVLTPASLSVGEAGTGYQQAFTATGGIAPYTFAVSAGALPAGLDLAADGRLAGTPTASGAFDVTVRATDAHGQSGQQAYRLDIATATLALAPASLPDGVVGASYAQAFSTTGGVAPYRYAVSAGTLPPGLQLAAGGQLSGTPTTAGVYRFDVRAGDSSTGTAGRVTASYTVTVAEAPPVAVGDSARTLAESAVAIAVTDNDSGVIDAIAIADPPGHGEVTVDGLVATYAPVAGFFGSDSFSYTASGPGGSSAAATVTIEVQPLPVPVGQPQSVTTLAGQAVSFDAARGATGGPFTGVTVTVPPATGELVVDGTRLTYTPPETAQGTVTIGYTLANAYGSSAPITATVTVNPMAIAAAHQAATVAGARVTVELTDNAHGGPFTAARVLSVAPAAAGSAVVTRHGEGDAAGYRLDFDAATDFAGTATVRYTLSNAHATSAPATVTIEVAARPDPTRDSEVAGLLRAQAASVRNLARGQLDNFQRRLESLHDGRQRGGFDNGLTVAIDRPCGERDWQIAGSLCRRPLGDEQAPVYRHAAADAGGPAPLFAIWASGAMRFGDYDPRRGASGFEFETRGISVGADYRLGPAFAFGGGLGYGRDITDIGEHGSRSEGESRSAALYASWHPGEHAYLDGLFGYQWLSFDLRRHVTANGARVRGERDGDQWFASLAAGYQWEHGPLGMTSYARLDTARATLDGYVEQGDAVFALAVAEQDIETTTTSLGLRLDYLYERDWGSFAPQLRLEYQHDLEADSVAALQYADQPAGPFYRAGIDGFDRNRFVIGLGAAWRRDDDLGLRLEYRSVLGSGMDDQSILLRVEKRY